jgi:hypothetical protein
MTHGLDVTLVETVDSQMVDDRGDPEGGNAFRSDDGVGFGFGRSGDRG